jgi:hypothetical protein
VQHRLKSFAWLPVGFLLIASQAQAAILCEGNFQILKGTAISTPYCQDENLAAIERTQGVRISGDAIREKPEVKHQACVNASSANETSCADYLSD